SPRHLQRAPFCLLLETSRPRALGLLGPGRNRDVDEPTVFTLHLLQFRIESLGFGPRVATGRPISKPIPATAVLRRRVRGFLVEPCVAVVSVCRDDAMLHPAGQCVLVDPETSREFLLGKQPTSAKSVAAQA